MHLGQEMLSDGEDNLFPLPTPPTHNTPSLPGKALAALPIDPLQAKFQSFSRGTQAQGVCSSLPATCLIRCATSSSVGVVTGLSTSSKCGTRRWAWARFLRRTVDCLFTFSLGDCLWTSARYVLSVLVSSLSAETTRESV